MPIETLADLFAAGAHRTVEFMLNTGRSDIGDIAQVLRGRYGDALTAPQGEIAALVGRVEDAIRAAQTTDLGGTPLIAEIPVAPGYLPNFSYTVIATITDIEKPGHTLSIPWPIYSDEPLSLNEIQERAEAELINWQNERGRLPGSPQGTDIHYEFRRMRFGAIISQIGAGREVVDYQVLSIYRGH